MWVPLTWVVGTLFGKATGKTWTAAATSAAVPIWISSQVYGLGLYAWSGGTAGSAGAAGRLAFAGQALWGMSVGGLVTGVGLGVVGGIATSQLLFGDKGKEDAIDFYTGKVSPGLWADTIAKAPGRVKAIVAANRAVENNAAGLPTGTPVESSYTAPGHTAFHSTGSAIGDENQVFW
jgi:hypothetical protein